MLYINNYNRDAEDAKYVAACMAQRERLNVTVSEGEIMTLEEIEALTDDYEEYMLDQEDWSRGQW